MSRAFTLVETVIALGVFSFAIVSVLGVMPTALTTIRQSSQCQVSGEIVASMTSELRSNPEVLADGSLGTGFPRYFDERGAVVETASEAIYEVTSDPAAAYVTLDGQAMNTSLQRASLRLTPIRDPSRVVSFQVSMPALP
jgi:hypothetical protein